MISPVWYSPTWDDGNLTTSAEGNWNRNQYSFRATRLHNKQTANNLKGQSRMDNPETLATLGTYDTG